jgi:hypothetical protein
MITERQITIVTRGVEGSGEVQVFLRVGDYLQETGITAPNTETAMKLVAAKLSGTA